MEMQSYRVQHFVLTFFLILVANSFVLANQDQPRHQAKIFVGKAYTQSFWVQVKAKDGEKTKTYKGKIVRIEDQYFEIRDQCPLCGYYQISYASVVSVKQSNSIVSQLRRAGKTLGTIPATPFLLYLCLTWKT